MDDVGQLYVLSDCGQDADDVKYEEEKNKETKKLKRTVLGVASDGATLCSTQVSSRKNKKMSSVREVCEYLTTHSIDRTQIWRKVGSVLELNEVGSGAGDRR